MSLFHVKLFLLFILLPLFGSSQISTIWLKDQLIPAPKKIDSAVLEWNAQQEKYISLSENAKQWLYWTNYARKDTRRFWDSAVAPILLTFPELEGKYSISLRRELYKHESLSLFSLNEGLLNTAQAHATDIANSEIRPGHVSSNGTGFSNRMKSAGIKFCAAENICVGNHSILLSLVLLFLDLDLPELGHRKNLLSPIFTDLGIGVAVLKDSSLFSVQDFSCPQQY